MPASAYKIKKLALCDLAPIAMTRGTPAHHPCTRAGTCNRRPATHRTYAHTTRRPSSQLPVAVPSACRTLTLATGRAVPHDISATAFRSSRTIRHQHQSRIDHLASHHQLLELAHARITAHWTPRTAAHRRVSGGAVSPSRLPLRRYYELRHRLRLIGDAVPCQHGIYIRNISRLSASSRYWCD